MSSGAEMMVQAVICGDARSMYRISMVAEGFKGRAK